MNTSDIDVTEKKTQDQSSEADAAASSSPQPVEQKGQAQTVAPVVGLVRGATMSSGILTLVGLFIFCFSETRFADVFRLPQQIGQYRLIFGAGFLGAGVLLVVSYLLSDWFPKYAASVRDMGEKASSISIPGVLYVSLISAASSEFLFRVVLQPSMGMFLVSVISAIVLFDEDGPVSSWGLWCFLSSLMFGWIYDGTGSFWASLTAHSAFNFILSLIVRYRFRLAMRTLARLAETSSPEGAS